MGIFGGRLAKQVAVDGSNVLAFPGATATVQGIRSPWSDGQLNQLVYSDIFGATFRPVTRAEALSVPAVLNARAILAGELAHRPLRALNAEGAVKSQPTWLYRTDTDVPTWHRLAATLDDWMFFGAALWVIKRGADDQVLDAAHLPFDRWKVNEANEILIDDEPVPEGLVAYLPGPFQGLLNTSQRTLRAAIDIEQSYSGRARTPAPAIILEQTDDIDLSAAEIKELLNSVSVARRDPDGAVMFSPKGINIRLEGDKSTELLEEGRNSARLDIAAALGLPSTALGAALPKASLNYETQQGQATVLHDRLTYWSAPLEARLSMDDIVPRGTRIRFDFSDDPAAPGPDTGPFTED